ncbi:ATP-binding protein [Micromonospora humida]|uniref:Helix-turn-helix domain-containing protein n=1 Tax=Micromonospora humida TaxID=2809018 RepID=A0ABS2IPJ6_9ACTN|nr:helix-turn-helix domain-containing protein [Micromonospora humida]MBM7076253.1 helix-turn-helix domain-containing protein [Micromonospora humida]
MNPIPSTPERPSLGAVLRAHRLAAGLSIEGLAERCGVSVRAISDIERDRVRRPQRRTLTVLCDVLDVPDDARRRLDEATSDRPAGCEPPAPPCHFTGRAAALRTLGDAARRPSGDRQQATVVVVTGPAGVGKTGLVARAAADLAPEFPDGCFFVDLRGMDDVPTPPGEALHLLLRALGVPERRIPAGLDERATAYRSVFCQRRALVVWDNAADEAQARPLLPGAGPGLVLVTSRRRLSGLDVARWLSLEPLPAEESTAMLRAIAAPDADADPTGWAELARHCGHMPLALRVTGQRLSDEPGLSVGELNRRFTGEQARLTVIDAGAAGIHTALSLSYRRLEADLRRTFRRLSLVPGPDFGPEPVAVVGDADVEEAERRLEALVESGLVAAVPADRYGLHDLVREFAADRMTAEEPATTGALRTTLLRWWLARTTAAGQHFEPGGPASLTEFPDRTAAAGWLDAERGNWFAALRSAAAEGLHGQVVDTVDALHWFSDSRVHLDVWPEVFRLSAGSAARLGDPRTEAVHLNYLSWAQAICQREYARSVATATRALERAVRAGDPAQQGWALLYAASGHTGLGEHAAALRHRQRAWVMLRRAADPEGLPQAMASLGSSLLALGRPAEALRVHERTRRLLRDPDHPIAAFARASTDALTCRRIGDDLAALGRWPECVAVRREAVSGLRATAMPAIEALALVELVEALRRTGATRSAPAYLARAIGLADDCDDPDLARRAGDLLAELSGAG